MADKSKLEAHAKAMVDAYPALHKMALACLTIELEAEPSEAEIRHAAKELAGINNAPAYKWEQFQNRARSILEAARSARLRELQDSNKEGGSS